MLILRRITFVGVIILLSAGLVGGASAYLGNALDFPESGYSVDGLYESYYNSLPDPLLTLGLPISVEIIKDQETMESFQFFSRAMLRKELVNNEYEIQREMLGYIIYRKLGVVEPIPANAPCRVFSNGRRVCYAFMQFYEANNGEVNFGQPVSELENENGRMVQYFEYARFEWRPEIYAESHVVLSDIGKIYMDIRGINPNYDNLNNIPPATETYTGPLNVLVFTKTPVAFPGGMQTVFVVVRDSALQGIAKANISLTLIYPDGSEQNLPPASSNKDGIYEVTFLVPADLPAEQIVQVHAFANSKGNSGAGQSWFRVRP